MTIDVNSLQTFSDADLLKIVKVAIAEVTLYGRLVTVRERTLERMDLKQLEDLRNDLESRINRAAAGRVVSYAKRVRG